MTCSVSPNLSTQGNLSSLNETRNHDVLSKITINGRSLQPHGFLTEQKGKEESVEDEQIQRMDERVTKFSHCEDLFQHPERLLEVM